MSYNAVLNENAKIGSTEGNKNKTRLTYGNETNTEWAETTTYTWKVDVKKYTTNNGTDVPLAGAIFSLSKNSDGSSPLALIRLKDANENDTNTYRMAKTGETGTVTTFTTPEDGKVYIQGLDADTYYLTETAAPEGYNMLTSSIQVVISNSGYTTGTGEDKTNKTTLTQTVKYTVDSEETTATNNVVNVLNNKGNTLPSTGGMGTTILYVAGGILIIGAAIFFVTNKRMQRN